MSMLDSEEERRTAEDGVLVNSHGRCADEAHNCCGNINCEYSVKNLKLSQRFTRLKRKLRFRNRSIVTVYLRKV